MFQLIIYLSILISISGFYQEPQRFNLYMPSVKPIYPDQYFCTAVKVDLQKSYYIVGFEPQASMQKVHHMILYGCQLPGQKALYWDCGLMTNRLSIDVAEPCASNTIMIYAWGRDAPRLELPDGVAFKIGKDTDIKYLVLQIHYNNVDSFKDGLTDRSGLYLNFVETPMPRQAGVLLLGTSGQIPMHSLESMETQCTIEENKIIHPFAFRVHTHALGVRVAGYRIRNLSSGEIVWSEIGEKDPLLPQMFFPVLQDIVIRQNDVVAAVCKMDASKRNRTTFVGPTSEEEMCNFYIMYWVEEGSPLKMQYCFSSGPPRYYWAMNMENIPEKEKLHYTRNEPIDNNNID